VDRDKITEKHIDAGILGGVLITIRNYQFSNPCPDVRLFSHKADCCCCCYFCTPRK